METKKEIYTTAIENLLCSLNMNHSHQNNYFAAVTFIKLYNVSSETERKHILNKLLEKVNADPKGYYQTTHLFLMNLFLKNENFDCFVQNVYLMTRETDPSFLVPILPSLNEPFLEFLSKEIENEEHSAKTLRFWIDLVVEKNSILALKALFSKFTDSVVLQSITRNVSVFVPLLQNKLMFPVFLEQLEHAVDSVFTQLVLPLIDQHMLGLLLFTSSSVLQRKQEVRKKAKETAKRWASSQKRVDGEMLELLLRAKDSVVLLEVVGWISENFTKELSEEVESVLGAVENNTNQLAFRKARSFSKKEKLHSLSAAMGLPEKTRKQALALLLEDNSEQKLQKFAAVVHLVETGRAGEWFGNLLQCKTPLTASDFAEGFFVLSRRKTLPPLFFVFLAEFLVKRPTESGFVEQVLLNTIIHKSWTEPAFAKDFENCLVLAGENAFQALGELPPALLERIRARGDFTLRDELVLYLNDQRF